MLKSLLKPSVEAILNDAIAQELHASQLYRHLAVQCQRLGLLGAAKYFKGESADEVEHYQGIVDYINDRGSAAKTPMIDSISDKVSDLGSALMLAYQAEVALDKQYNAWYSEIEEDDPSTARFILKYLEIQTESVGFYGDMLSRLALADNEGAGILLLDKELGEL